MTKQLMGKCPKCNQNIEDEISNYWYKRLPVTNFDFECPYCATALEVEAVPTPVFMVSWQEPVTKPD